MGEHPNSILANIDKLSPELQKKYYANKAKAEGDYDAMERWASAGFNPAEDEDDSVTYDDPAYD